MNRERENKNKSEEKYINIRKKAEIIVVYSCDSSFYTLRTCKNKIYMQ